MTRKLPVGSTAVVQEVWRDRVFSARPTIVVSDEDDVLALWTPPGTKVRGPDTPPTRLRAATKIERFIANLQGCDWDYKGRLWTASTLFLIPPERWHATWLAWDQDGELLWGYVNFQRPAIRRRDRVQTMDLALDLVLSPNGDVATKDEDHFDRLRDVGLIDAAAAAQVENERHLVLDEIRSGTLYSQQWLSWQPEDQWSIPVLPGDWQATA